MKRVILDIAKHEFKGKHVGFTVAWYYECELHEQDTAFKTTHIYLSDFEDHARRIHDQAVIDYPDHTGEHVQKTFLMPFKEFLKEENDIIEDYLNSDYFKP